ncbi:MAG TPA: hypothetical protein VGF55_03900 [Gemmataceae bacterium]|jgi:hypothetical protein
MPLDLQISALAVSAIYYLWRDGYLAHLRREHVRRQRMLRERVAYMLWSAAQHCH